MRRLISRDEVETEDGYGFVVEKYLEGGLYGFVIENAVGEWLETGSGYAGMGYMQSNIENMITYHRDETKKRIIKLLDEIHLPLRTT